MEDNKKKLNNNSVQEIFNALINQISTKLNLTPIIKNVTVILGKEQEFDTELSSPRGLVKLEKKDANSVLLEISPKFPEFLPFLLRREAYFCFLPDALTNNIQIQFFIYMLIELDLPREKYIDKWKEQIRKIDKFSPYFSYQFESGNRLFQFKFPNSEKSILSTLFNYFRKQNIDIPQGYFYPHLMRIYINSLKQAYKENKDLLETIRILDIIFNKVKNYRALLDYEEYFKKSKETGFLQTYLSLRKFISNVRWISRYSFCSPIYLLDWNTIGLSFFLAHLRFHPSLPWYQINLFLQKLPFNLVSEFLISGFSREYFGYIIIPSKYIGDLERFLAVLLENGFLINAEMYPILKNQYFFNLNYLMESASNQKFVASSFRSFHKELILESSHRYANKCLISELELLDFLILERARQVSFTGFGFERRESTLSTIRDDYITEVSKQKKIILTLRVILREVSQDVDLRKNCLEFISKNQNLGYFALYDRIIQINEVIRQLKFFLQTRETRVSAADLLNHLNNYGLFNNLRQNLKLKNPKIKSFVLKKLFPLYYNNVNQFNEEERIYTILLRIFDSCNELKLYDIISIQNIIKDPSIFETLYNEKEQRIERIYSQSLLKNITSNEVEMRLENFVSTTPPIISPCLTNSLITLTTDKNVVSLILDSGKDTISKLRKLAKEVPSVIYHEIKNNLSEKPWLYCVLNLPHMDIDERNTLLGTFQYLFQEKIMSNNQAISIGITPTITRRNFYDFIENKFFYTPFLFEHYSLYSRSLFGENIPRLEEVPWNISITKLYENTNFSDLLKEINKKREDEILKLDILPDLGSILNEIEVTFMNKNEWANLKKNSIYTQFIKSLKFQPFFSLFGLQEYHIYFRPINMNIIDLKLLLSNSFTSFRFREFSKSSYCFIIKFLFPINNPNIGYFSWLILSKKNISEYCLFTFKNEYSLYDFSHNIEIEDNFINWTLDISQFISHVEKVLFLSKKHTFPFKYKKRTFLDEERINDFTPQDPDFMKLRILYPKETKDLKFIGTLPKDDKIYSNLRTLIKHKKGFLDINTSNLQLHQKVVFILPSIKENIINPILEIFKFFNKVKIHEIKGEYYLHSFLKVKSFDQGLCIKIWFPDIDINNFIEYFTEIFTYFDIPHVLMYSGLNDGKIYLNNLYKGIDLKNDYNPLLNFKWNPIDKIWMAPKLFKEEFKPLYPPLIPQLDTHGKNSNEENRIN